MFVWSKLITVSIFANWLKKRNKADSSQIYRVFVNHYSLFFVNQTLQLFNICSIFEKKKSIYSKFTIFKKDQMWWFINHTLCKWCVTLLCLLVTTQNNTKTVAKTKRIATFRFILNKYLVCFIVQKCI